MLWLVLKNASHAIIACNIHEENGVYQLWVTRANGKSLKVEESTNKKDIETLRGAIDFAIETGETVLRLT